jgi:hypothetical protein
MFACPATPRFLLEMNISGPTNLVLWVTQTPYLAKSAVTDSITPDQWLQELIRDLERSKAVRCEGEMILDLKSLKH